MSEEFIIPPLIWTVGGMLLLELLFFNKIIPIEYFVKIHVISAVLLLCMNYGFFSAWFIHKKKEEET